MKYTMLIPFLILGCSLISGPDLGDGEFVVRVDEFEVPSAIQEYDTLHIVARGTSIGQDSGCFYLERVESVRSRDRLELTFVGLDLSGPDIFCLAIPTPLNWKGAIAPRFNPPTFTVVVNQPDGSQIVREVTVEGSLYIDGPSMES